MNPKRMFQLSIIPFFLFSACLEKERSDREEHDGQNNLYVDFGLNKGGNPAGLWVYYDFYGHKLMEIKYLHPDVPNTYKIFNFSINQDLISYQYYTNGELFHSFSFEYSDFQDELKGKVLFEKYCQKCHDLHGEVIGPALIPSIKGGTTEKRHRKLERGLIKANHKMDIGSGINFDSLDLLFLVKYIESGGEIVDP